jgi:hypothetical protein
MHDGIQYVINSVLVIECVNFFMKIIFSLGYSLMNSKSKLKSFHFLNPICCVCSAHVLIVCKRSISLILLHSHYACSVRLKKVDLKILEKEN